MPTLKIDIETAENLAMFEKGKVVGDYQIKENSIIGTTRWGVSHRLVIEPIFAPETYYSAKYQVGVGDEGGLNFNSVLMGEQVEFYQVYPREVTVTHFYTKKDIEKFMKEEDDNSHEKP